MNVRSGWQEIPKEDKKIRDLLRPGVLVDVYLRDLKPQRKPKWLILVGQRRRDGERVFCSVYLNSKINGKVHSKEEDKKLQLKLEKTTSPYLDRNSYADCKTIREDNLEDLKRIILKTDHPRYCEIPNFDLERIKSLIAASPTVTGKVKEAYGLPPL